MPDCGQYLTEPIEAPANYKDPQKIAAYIAEARQRQIEKAALDLDLCEIVAIGWGLPVAEDSPGDCIYSQTRERTSEADMLSGFWLFVHAVQRDGGVIVGYNCLAFDLPVLLRRSLYLGVPAPSLQIDKYRHDGIIDLLAVLSHNGQQPMRSLGFYAKRFGLPHDDSVSGAEIPALAAAGQWDQIAAHCKADVQTTAALAARMGLIYMAQDEAAPVPPTVQVV